MMSYNLGPTGSGKIERKSEDLINLPPINVPESTINDLEKEANRKPEVEKSTLVDKLADKGYKYYDPLSKPKSFFTKKKKRRKKKKK